MTSTALAIAGIALSLVAIALGLFMLLSKSHAGDAEGVWQDKLKTKGPVGLFVFYIGAALLVVIMRQITPARTLTAASDSFRTLPNGYILGDQRVVRIR